MNKIKLTVCICSVMQRINNFLPIILNEIDRQTKDRLDVEVLVLIDNKKRGLGEKRNEMVNIAKGMYLTFIDDDDRISADYIDTLVNAIDSNPNVDVINFISNVSLNGSEYKPMYFSLKNLSNYHDDFKYYRSPNQLMCIRIDLAKSTPYVLVGYEDFIYMADLLPKLKTEYNIDKVLYYYDFSNDTTETQRRNKK